MDSTNLTPQIDVLICSVPAGMINRAPAAPALLKGCVQAAGFRATTIDLSLTLFLDFCASDFVRYTEVNRLFDVQVPWIDHPVISAWLDRCVEIIHEISPRYLAISVFSVAQHRATFLLCQQIKARGAAMPIILGGYGLPEKYQISFQGFCTAPMAGLERFGDFLKRQNLADFFIYGEGEQQLVDVLLGKQPDAALVDLETVAMSDFDDYHLDQYLWHNDPVLTLTGSKGCVRKCRFCNVPRKFGKYRQRSGKHIAQEMIALSARYNIHKFEFTDSLVNGNFKEFLDLIRILAEHNEGTATPIRWYGQYICRPQNQIPQGTYELIKKSGAEHLIIGAESGSDEVLAAMNKKITVKDIFDELEQFEKHNLTCQLLILVGFYNETWPRFIETLEFLCRCHRYIAAGVISKIAPGLPLAIEEGGYLHLHAQDLGIIIDDHNTTNWRVVDDPSYTWLERVRRKAIIQSVLLQMGVSITVNGIQEIQTLIEKLKLYEQQLLSPSSGFDIGQFEPGVH